jgi:hypothetical protein
MNSNNKIPFHLIGKEGIPYACNFIPAEQGWLELPNYIDDLVSSARCQAASMIEAWIDDEDFIEHMNYVKEHEIKLEDLTLYLNVALIVANKDIFIIYISDFLDHLVWPVHFDNSSDKISEWEISCGGWPAVKDDILKYYIPEI